MHLYFLWGVSDRTSGRFPCFRFQISNRGWVSLWARGVSGKTGSRFSFFAVDSSSKDSEYKESEEKRESAGALSPIGQGPSTCRRKPFSTNDASSDARKRNFSGR